MILSSKAINNFVMAYRLDFGVELSEKEARIKAEELIRFTQVIARKTSELVQERDNV